ncbi:MAG: hypothetical protein ACI4JM_13535 [Oscillospiraceae bacterium]
MIFILYQYSSQSVLDISKFGGRVLEFDVSSDQNIKTYTTETGETIIYGIRNQIKTISFTLEGTHELCGEVENMLKEYQLYLEHNYDGSTQKMLVMKSSSISKKCISKGADIWTISCMVKEV